MNGDNSKTGSQVIQPTDNRMAFSLLLADIKAIIKEARSAAYAGINAVQMDQNWKIGKRIVEEEQGGKIRAEYGKRTIAELSAQLCAEFGEGYSERNLWEFRKFYVVFPDIEILHTRVQNLSWSHFRAIMRVSDPVAREWYINEASNEQPDDNPTIGIVLCADTDPDIARYSILKGNERLFATKYKLNLPTPEELTEEVARQKATLMMQLSEKGAK